MMYLLIATFTYSAYLSDTYIYEYIGPGFWGLINPQWNMCNKGRRQSPINVEPEKLLFDPYLRPFYIDKHKVSTISRQFIGTNEQFIHLE